MAQTIKLRRSATSGAQPTTSQLELGELALNTYDGKVYMKKSVGGTESIVEVSGGGGSGATGTMYTDEFSGTGSATDFTLSVAPVSEDDLIVFIDGVYQNLNSYSISGTTLTFDTAPDNGTTIIVHHIQGGILGTAPVINTMTGNGVLTTLTLSVAPSSENQTFVTFDGVVQHKDTYSVSGTTLTFSEAVPNGVTVECVTFRNVQVATFEDADGDTKIQVEETADEDKIRFDTGGTERMIIDSTGVGIGTTSPSHELSISKTATGITDNPTLQIINAWTTEGNNIGFSNRALALLEAGNGTVKTKIQTRYDTNANLGEIGTETNHDFRFVTNNIERARISSSGNLGIGTTSPSEKLHITDSTARIRLQDSDGTNQFLILQQDGTNSVIRSRNGTSNGVILFQGNNGTSNTTYGIFNAAGNLGIGTGSPLARMHVVQDSAGVNTVARFENTSQATSLVQFQDTSTTTRPRIGSVANNLILDTANTERVRIDSSGNVGIGTTSPSALLDVNIDGNTGRFSRSGTQYIEVSATSGGQSILSTSGTNKTLFIGTTDSNHLRLQTNGSNALSIDSSQNIGIGTTNPSAKLSVVDATTDFMSIFTNSTSSGNGLRIQAGDNSGDRILQLDDKDGNEKLRVTATGNVGIGDSAPPSTLTVLGDNSADVASVGAGINGLQITRTTGSGENLYAYIGNTSFTGWSGSTFPARIENFGCNVLEIGSQQSTPISFGTNNTERMRIDSSGNLLVGTTDNNVTNNSGNTPGINIGVAGIKGYIAAARYQGAPLALNRLNNNGDIAVFSSDGTTVGVIGTQNWGIGTGSPAYELDVKSATSSVASIRVLGNGAGSELLIETTTNNANGTIKFGDVDDDDIGYIQYGHSANYLRFGTSATERMRIDSSGNVGIGTTSPTRALDVNGGIAISGSQVITPARNLTNIGTISSGNITASGADAQILATGDNAIALHQDAAWVSNLLFGAKHDGSNQVYGASSRGAFKIVGLHDSDTSPQYLAIYGANQGTAGNTISWNTVGFVQDEDGLVGIGLTDPSYPLEVAGAGTVSIAYQRTGVSAKKWGFHTDNSNTYWHNITDNVLALTVSNAGNLGIGTTSPSTNLHLVASSPQIRLQHSGNSFFSRIITDSGNNLILGTGSNGTERMRIDNDGDIKLSNNANNAPSISGNTEVAIADDSTITVQGTEAGAMIICVYKTDGHFGIFGAGYADTTTLIDGSSGASTSDSDGSRICVFKSANSHTVTIKNRTGASGNYYISIFAAFLGV